MTISFNSSIGMLCLAVYLILVGLSAFIPMIHVPSVVLGVLALVSGICILIGK